MAGGAPPASLVAGLALLVFLPVLLGIGFARERRESRERQDHEEAEIALQRAARKMATAVQPMAALGMALRRLELEWDFTYTPRGVASLARLLRRHLPCDPRLYVFDPVGRLLLPRRPFAQRAERENLWRTLIDRRLSVDDHPGPVADAAGDPSRPPRRDRSPRADRLPRADRPPRTDRSRREAGRRPTLGDHARAARAMARLYGPFLGFNELDKNQNFDTFYEDRRQERIFLAVNFSRDPGRPGLPGHFLEVWESRIPPAFFDREILALRPDEADGAILFRDGQEAGRSGLPAPASWPSLAPGRLQATVDHFWFRYDPGPGRILLLHRARSHLGGLRPRDWLTLEALLCLCGGTAGWWVARRVADPEGYRLPLRTQILGGLLLAASFPLAGLLSLGLSRAADIDTLVRQAFRARMADLTRAVDLHFRNTVESYQRVARRQAAEIEARLAAGQPLLPAMDRFQPYLTSVVLTLEDVLTVPDRLKYGRREVGDILRKVFLLMSTDLLEGFRPAGRPGKGKVRLGLRDMFGEGHPLFDLPKRIGRLNRVAFGTINHFGYHEFLRTPQGRVRGLAFAFLDSGTLARRYREWLARPRFLATDSLFFFSGISSNVAPGFLKESRDLRELLGRVRDTGAPEERTIEAAGQQWLVWARFPQFFYEFMLGAAVPVTALSGHRQGILAGLALGAGAGLCVLLAGGGLLFRRILAPIRTLTEAGRRIAGEGRATDPAATDGFDALPDPLTVETDDELGRLADSFNGMVTGLRERERMRRFLSSSAWEGAARPDEEAGRREEAVVLFSDLRSFTTLSETHPPQDVVDMLNDYFTLMDRAIRAEGGDIDTFIGDAIVAVFRDQADRSPAVERAVQAAIAMRRALARLNRRRRELGQFEIENGIGLEWGPLVLGRVGAAAGRSAFTGLGAVVGRAMELEALSKLGRASRVIVSEAVVGRLDGGSPGGAGNGGFVSPSMSAGGPFQPAAARIGRLPLAGSPRPAWELETKDGSA